jgi:adenylate cyclase
MADRDIEISDRVSDADIAELRAALNEYNFATTGYRDGRSLSCFLRDDGALVAGIDGFTWGGYARIDLLWVDEPRRGQGLGRALLAAAEAEARRRGCKVIVLDTHSFQAPDLYPALGYEKVGETTDTPVGHSQLMFQKRLRDPGPPRSPVALTIDELTAAGLYDSDAPDADERLSLLRALESRGGTLEHMVSAQRSGRLQRLAAELLVYGDIERLTAAQVASAAGVEPDRFSEVWRAAGFPHPAPDDLRFSNAEVELVRTVELAADLFGDAATMQLVRVVGSSVSRIADAAVSTFVTTIGARSVAADAAATALAEANEAAIALFPQLSETMAQLLRQHLIEASRPTISASTAGYDSVVAAIGFVDVVGSTGLALRVPLEDIGRAIEAFEQHAADVVAANHGRVVKFIGDEVMFRVHDAASACRIALEIVDRFSNDPLLPGVRAAVAFGDLLVRDGDYFGPVVNLAARATKLAPPGGVVATEEARAAALPTGAFAFELMPARSLKGFDEPVTLYTIATRQA